MKNLIKTLVKKVRIRDLDPNEAGEYSSGHLPQLVRHAALDTHAAYQRTHS